MKLNPFFVMISILLSALIGYALWMYSQHSFKELFVTMGSIGTCLLIVFFLALNYDNNRLAINLKTLTSLFMLINVCVLIFFMSAIRTQTAFIIIYGVFLLVYVSLIYSIIKKSQ